MQDLAATEDRLAAARSELQQSHQTLEQKQERIEQVEARSRDLYDTTVRLEAHIADLESRKRAPLYQKKQEEELKAAIEKAQECEIRAVEAEIKYKEAKVGCNSVFKILWPSTRGCVSTIRVSSPIASDVHCGRRLCAWYDRHNEFPPKNTADSHQAEWTHVLYYTSAAD